MSNSLSTSESPEKAPPQAGGQEEAPNPLGYEKIGKLLTRFAVPSIISFLVGAIYNIVDQAFIGQSMGVLGNAATNVAFPLTTICMTIAMTLGLGGAMAFNLDQGAGRKEEASRVAACSVTLLIAAGIILTAVVLIFLNPIVQAFGSTGPVTPYATTYVAITSVGFLFFIFSTAFSVLIRGDGSPKYAMFSMIIGAVINVVLDALFIFVFNWGIAGAAWATVIGQIVSGVLCFLYLFHFRHATFKREYFFPTLRLVKRIVLLGLSGLVNQLSLALVQIAMNNILTRYGAQSVYGAEIPLAVSGIITKVSTIVNAFIIGIAQGNQPIVGFNYGAQQYARVKRSWKMAALAGFLSTLISFLIFQIFPLQIISLFGEGSAEYFIFAERYFRIFMSMFFLTGLHIVTMNFFGSIGKPIKGVLIGLTRQIFVFIPLLIIIPIFFGIEGAMFASPIADIAGTVVALTLIAREFKIMGKDQDRPSVLSTG